MDSGSKIFIQNTGNPDASISGIGAPLGYKQTSVDLLRPPAASVTQAQSPDLSQLAPKDAGQVDIAPYSLGEGPHQPVIPADQETGHRVKGTKLILTKNESYWLSIIMWVIFILLIVVAMYTLIYFIFVGRKESAPNKSKKPAYDPDLVDQDLGGSEDGVVVNTGNTPNGGALNTKEACDAMAPRTHWNGTSCDCIAPYYGATCAYESWDSRFFAFGRSADIGNSILFESYVPEEYDGHRTFKVGGEYDENSCSAISMRDRESVGFYHNGSRCEIIRGPISIQSGTSVTYSRADPNYLYMKRGKGPIVPNIVFAMGRGNGAIRYYVARPDDDHFAKIQDGLQHVVNFTPEFLINASEMVGIWSPKAFDPKDFDSMYRDGTCHDKYFIDTGGAYSYYVKFNSKIVSSKYYVMYKQRSAVGCHR